jgi:hypothetical protein
MELMITFWTLIPEWRPLRLKDCVQGKCIDVKRQKTIPDAPSCAKAAQTIHDLSACDFFQLG